MDERHVQDVVRRRLGGVARQGGGGERVPVVDHGRVVGAHRRRCRCAGRAGGQGGEEDGDGDGSQPAAELRLTWSPRTVTA